MTISKKKLEDYQALLNGCQTRIKSDIKEFYDIPSLHDELIEQLVTVKSMQTYFKKFDGEKTNDTA